MPAIRSHIAVRQDQNGNTLPLPGSGQNFELDLRSYAVQRQQLIENEKAQRFDAAKLQSLTEAETKANEVVDVLKRHEDERVYSNPQDLTVIKGIDWETAKARGVQQGKLFQLIRKMPKGAVLHCHMDATVEAKWIVENARQISNMHIAASAPLTTKTSLYTSEVKFCPLSQEEKISRRPSPQTQDIFSSTYQPDTWVPLDLARSQFPYGNVYGQSSTSRESNFDTYLISLLTMHPVDTTYAAPIITSKQAWSKFLTTFGTIAGLCMNENLIHAYLLKSFEGFIADNICYVEMRVNFWLRKGSRIEHVDLVKAFDTALEKTKTTLPAGKTFDAKIIYSTVRVIDNKELRWYVEDAISLKQQFPHLFVGFDLVGHEDPGVTLHEYAPELLRMQQRVAELGLNFPFVFHAGETTSDGDNTDHNLFDAVLLGTKRIGHGYSLIKHPHLIDLVKERSICVESCPISNQLLRFASSTAVHPVLSLLARSVPVAISNDDPTQFENPGLTPDFYQLLSASDYFTLASLGVLARGSIVHSLMNDKQKEATLAQWDKEWSVFIDHVASQSD